MPVEVGDFLRRNRRALAAKWEAKVSGSLPADARVLADRRREGRRRFLDGVIAALEERRDGDGGPGPISGDGGAQLLRECGPLLASVAELSAEKKKGAGLDRKGLLELATCLFSGAADAGKDQGRDQEERQRRADFEYFGFALHEMGSPLAAVRLSWDLIARTGELDPGGREILTRGLAQLTELVDHSITLLQVAAGVDAGHERVPVDELVAETLAASIVDPEAKRIRIDVDASPLVVEVDRRLLRFALTNLLRSAVRSTRECGEVAIRSRRSGGRVLIEVEHERGALPAGGLDRDDGELGPALASSRRAMEAHGGTLRVQQSPGGRCTFTLELPDPDAGRP